MMKAVRLYSCLVLLLTWVFPVAAVETLLQNMALQARASATSEHNKHYQARHAIDGKIPVPGSQSDLDQAWCVQGATHRNGADFVLEWSNEVLVAEVVYHGRTAWYAEECWKDCELFLDDSTVPAARHQFERGAGPQSIRLDTPARARKLTLKFTSSYGGLNPGASEIQVYSTPLPRAALASFKKLPQGRPEWSEEMPLEETPSLARALKEGRLGFESLLMIQRRELNPSHVYTYHVEGFGAGGGLYVVPVKNPGAGMKKLVDSSEGQILDCDLSHDGSEILFSWRRRKDQGYHLFSIRPDGSGLRQLTDGPQHDYNACWLPDGGIAFLPTRSSRFAYCWISPVGILHRMERDGSRVVPLSANIVNDFTPSVLNDGRILYSRWEYVDKPAIPIQSLWAIHPDGTGLSGFFGNRVLSPPTFMEARSIPGSTRVLCTLTSHNGPARGAIGIIDVSYGNNAPAGIRNLTPEVSIGEVDKGDGNRIRGPYENPYPLDGQYFLVSKRGTVLVRDYAGKELAVVVRARDGLGYYSPMPFCARSKPPVLASQAGLVRGGRMPSPAASPEGAEAIEWASVTLHDVYRGLEPDVKRGEIREICVVEEMRKAVRTDVKNRAFGFQFPVISCGATYACKRVWGYAPVAQDGSASFQVPAGRPVYFMALDSQGRAVQRMRTFTHLMPGEQQGCVGCHEPRQNTTVNLTARHRPVDKLRPPEWGEGIGFDYSTVVQPVLDRHCLSCHSGPNPPNKVDLCGDKTDFFNVSYEVLARGRKKSGEAEWESPYVSWIPTYNGMEQNILEVRPKRWGSPVSKLSDIVVSGHPDGKGGFRIQLSSEERRRILAWIDLNVPYYGTSETAYPEKVGCRRLYPETLDKTLSDVSTRRCAECHKEGKIPRQSWVRITHPERNPFLMAPLSVADGGSGRCGRTVFQGTNDADYQSILKTFESIAASLRERPRMDMPGSKPAAVDRNCLGQLY